MTSVKLSKEDFECHVYILGRTGCGKTTLIRNVLLSLAAQEGVPCFFIDPKGIDALQLLKEAPDLSAVTFLDPSRGFALNPFELPPYEKSERDRVVSCYIGHFESLMSEWFHADMATYGPRMTRIFESILRYLYSRTDTPTFIDLNDLARAFSSREKEEINAMLNYIASTVSGEELYELRRDLEAISRMRSEAFDPILTRVSKFATDPFLRRIFSCRRSNVDFNSLFEPGHLTVVRVAPQAIGAHLVPLVMSAFCLHLWFRVMFRAEVESCTDLVVLAVDEFQNLESLNLVRPILAQARAFKLGLILAHQNTAQVSDELLQTVLGNAATQVVGRVSGYDAAKIARSWEPAYKAEVETELVTIPDYMFLVRVKPMPGEEQPLPERIRAPPPPPELRTDAQVREWIDEQVKLRGFGQPATSIFRGLTAATRTFERFLPMGLPSLLQWQIIYTLRSASPGGWTYTHTCTIGGLPRDQQTRREFNILINRGIIVLQKTVKGTPYYKLGAKALRAYFNPDFSRVAPSAEGQALARRAFEAHLSPVELVCAAEQHVGERAPDLVSYNYKTMTATAIEIESTTEIETHPEQIKRNVTKWSELGFNRCEVWFHRKHEAKLRKLLGSLVELKPAEV